MKAPGCAIEVSSLAAQLLLLLLQLPFEMPLIVVHLLLESAGYTDFRTRGKGGVGK